MCAWLNVFLLISLSAGIGSGFSTLAVLVLPLHLLALGPALLYARDEHPVFGYSKAVESTQLQIMDVPLQKKLLCVR